MSLCGNCFLEGDGAGPCRFCGYDPREDAERFPMALPPGSILNGRYIVGRALGQGGFGITYLALDDRDGKHIAVKEFFPASFANRGADGRVHVHSVKQQENFDYGKTQFLEEARTLAAVGGSEHVVAVHSYFEENGTAYFTMDYVQGMSLDKFMRRKGGVLTAQKAEELLLPLMEAMETVHRKGVVHRDIAPDNIIVTPEGEAKLIDFGAARYSTGERTESLTIILKHGFAPYEQYMRRGRQGPWTDVYAMAATFYYAITGEVPPDATERKDVDMLKSPSALGMHLDKETEAALLKGLAVQREERWQNMGDFAAALRAEPGTRDPGGRNNLLLLLAAAVLVLLAVFVPSLQSAKPAPAETAAPAAAAAAPASTPGAILKQTPAPSQAPTPRPTPTPSLAPATVEENGLQFTLCDDHAELTGADETLTVIVVPDTVRGKPVTGIAERAFFEHSALERAVLPDCVTSIGDNAFSRCSRLREVTLPKGPATVGRGAFLDCGALTGVTLPAGMPAIEDYLFSGCTSLAWVAIPEGPISVGCNVFIDCDSLRVIELPASVEDVSDGAFSYCRGLVSLTLPGGLLSMGKDLFDGCSSLKSVTIPESVIYFGDSCFTDCPSLTAIHVKAGSHAAQFFRNEPCLEIDEKNVLVP